MTALEQGEKWFLKRKLHGDLSQIPNSARPRDDLVTRRHLAAPISRSTDGGYGIGGSISVRNPVERKALADEKFAVRQPNSRRQGLFTKRHNRQRRLHVSQPALTEKHHDKCIANGTAPRTCTVGNSLPVGLDSVGVMDGIQPPPPPPPSAKESGPDPEHKDDVLLPSIHRGQNWNSAKHSDAQSDDSDSDIWTLPRRSAKERRALRALEHNWILKDQLQDLSKSFERRRLHLTIHVADDDPLVVIKKRLEEIRQMAAGKASKASVLDRYEPHVRNLILKYKDIPVQQIRTSRLNENPKSIDRFKHAGSLVILLLRGLSGSQIYFSEQEDAGQSRSRMPTVANSRHLATGRGGFGYELQLALTTQPHLRDKKAMKQILWILRATKAFKHLFPTEMEEELARNVAYERYDDGRVIAWQDRAPDRFYYVISGRVNLLRQYKLTSGQVTKSMGFLVKGMTTDPQEIDKQWKREENLVSKGQVEVLLLDKKSFRQLQHTTDGLPAEFLKSLHLFQEFPIDKFGINHDAIEVKYYGAGKTIVKDSNRTPWLHVIKSGFVKVVRRQSVIDTKLSNESKFSASTVERLGCGKAFSHADAMLGLQAKQKKMKAFRKGLVLPQLGAPLYGMSANPLEITLGLSTPAIYRQKPQNSASHFIDDDAEDEEDREENENEEEREDEELADDKHSKPRSTTKHHHQQKQQQNGSLINITDFEPHDLWLTREKTGNDVIFPRSKKKEVPHRRAYLQLDVLKPGDVFGLDHLQPALASEPIGVSLLSDGAEIVKISKRFFLQNADNNTMLKVETMYKEYLSEKEAERSLYDQETWEQYKEALWNRIIASRPPLQTHRPALPTHRPALPTHRPDLTTHRPVLPTHNK